MLGGGPVVAALAAHLTAAGETSLATLGAGDAVGPARRGPGGGRACSPPPARAARGGWPSAWPAGGARTGPATSRRP